MPPETKASREAREEAFERYAKSVQKFKEAYPEDAAMIQSWIDEVDFDELREIFLEYAIKSGVPAERMNFVRKQDVLIMGSEDAHDAVLSFATATNVIRVFAPEYLGTNAMKSASDSAKKFIFLHSLFHEYGHVTSRVLHKPTEHTSTDEEDMSTISMQSGLSKDIIRMKHSRKEPFETSEEETSLFNLLNEGVNDRIADEVFLEYVRRRPFSAGPDELPSVIRAKIYVGSISADTASDYGLARHFVTALVQALAEVGEKIPEEAVWRGFVGAFYRGDMLDEEEIKGLLDETFGAGFVEELAAVEDGEGVEALATARLRQSLTDTRLVDKWMSHFDLTRGAK